MIETTWGASSLSGEVEVHATRQMPQNLQVAVNLNLQFPPGLDPAAQQALQQFLQAAQQAIVQQAHDAVQHALQAQAPISKIDVAFRGGAWRFAGD